MKIKSFFQSSLLIALCAVGSYYIMCGKQGVRTYLALLHEHHQEQQKVVKLEQKIAELQAQIAGWNANSFECEKCARQDLSLSCTNELVYRLPQ